MELLSLTMTTQLGCSSPNGMIYDDEILTGEELIR